VLATIRWKKLLRYGWTLARAVRVESVLRLAGGLEGALVQIENTNYCNYHCTYCPTHSPGSTLEVRRGHMSMATFEAILEANPKARLAVIQGQGEPLMDPTVFEKLAAARARGIATQIITNGSLLSEQMNRRLWKEGPELLLVSVDAVSAERNAAQRAGMKFEKVIEGIKALTSTRPPSGRAMVVGLLSIVHGPFDAETETALRSFNALGLDVVYYKQLNPSYENRIAGYRAPAIDAVPAPVRRALNYPLSHQRITPLSPCAQLHYDFPYYLWDGTRTPCCVLNDRRYSAPQFRPEQLRVRFAQRQMPTECEKCSFFAGYPAAQ
jgi:pyruvate-formate lyase-activating enzyme